MAPYDIYDNYLEGRTFYEDRLGATGTKDIRKEDVDADLISLASGSRGLTRTILLGSTASRVQHSAPCPVLVCRPTPGSERAIG